MCGTGRVGALARGRVSIKDTKAAVIAEKGVDLRWLARQGVHKWCQPINGKRLGVSGQRYSVHAKTVTSILMYRVVSHSRCCPPQSNDDKAIM